MKLEEQVSNFELSKKLYELGFKSDSYFCWVENPELKGVEVRIKTLLPMLKKYLPAYTTAELGKLLPKVISHNLNNWSGGYYIIFAYSNQNELGESNPCVWYEDNDLSDEDSRLNGTEAKTEADARAQMLIWLIENGKIVIDEKK